MNNYTNQILQTFGYTPDQINPDYSTPRLLQYIIGIDGAVDCDFNFAADAVTHDPQILDLGLVIPYQWHIRYMIVECIEAAAGVADFNIAAGCSLACITIPIYPLATDGLIVQSEQNPESDNNLVRPLYFYGDPTNLTWGDLVGGKWLVTILLNDFSML